MNALFLAGMVGIASWYGHELDGRIMANRKPFNPHALTCASYHYPLGTWLRVVNPANGRHVDVLVCDRGPHKRLRRVIDLSEAAFERIADRRVGLVKVRIERQHDTKNKRARR